MESRRSNATFHGVKYPSPGMHGVYVLRNFFSHTECDTIVEESEEWSTTRAKVYTDTKKDIELLDERKGSVRHWKSEQGWNWIHPILATAAHRYTDDYPSHPKFNKQNPKLDIEVACYEDVGDHFAPHQDQYLKSAHILSSPNHIRKLSMSCILSDEYAGAELCFKADGQWIPMDLYKGDIIIFPSYHEHMVKPLLDGKRYSLICWVLGDFWR